MHFVARIMVLGLVGIGLCSAAQEPQQLTLTEGDQPFTAAHGPSLALAIEAAQTAIDACKALHANVAVSVVDSAGIIKLTMASDDTFARGVTSSIKKALTAKDFNMSTADLSAKAKADPALAARIKSNPTYLLAAGGMPLRVGNDVIGGVGVGGSRGGDPNYPAGAPNRDGLCAKAAVDKIQARLN